VLILVETHSLSWAESVRLTLLANGIESIVLDQASPGTLGLMGSIRVAIVDESALPRAAKLVADLQPPRSGPLPSWRWHKRALVLLGTGFVFLSLGTRMAESASMPAFEFLVAVAGALMIVGGFSLVFVGYRVDKRRDTAQSEEQ